MKKELGMAGVLMALCLIIGLSNSDFYGTANVLNTARQTAMAGILAVGMGFVIICGGIDLSVGSIAGLTGVIVAKISAPPSGGGLGMSLGLGITVAMAVALAVGLAQGLIITRLKMAPFMVTLAGMLLLRGVSQTVCDGGTISFGDSHFRDLADSGIELGSLMIQYPVVIFLTVLLLGAYLLHFTVFGRYVFAIGGNREAARYSGVNVLRTETVVYIISAGLAGLAGIVYAAYIGRMSHNVGVSYELVAIASVVLGGCSLNGGEGTILGIFIGTAIMKVIENGINVFKVVYTDASGVPQTWRLDVNWRNIVIGVVILGAVILDRVVHIMQNKKRIKHS
jgi:ribose transport system permease protein